MMKKSLASVNNPNIIFKKNYDFQWEQRAGYVLKLIIFHAVKIKADHR